jgi:hypothetical protein
MINLEPTKDEFAQIEKACTEKGVRPTVIGTDLLDAYKRGDFTLTNMGEYLDAQKEKRPHWFATIAADDLEQRAFGQNNQTARAQLYKQLGPVEYSEREKAWGAENFKAGKAPTGANDSTKAKPGKDNPWLGSNWNTTKQGQIVRALGLAAAQRIAKAAGSYVGATKPAKAA